MTTQLHLALFVALLLLGASLALWADDGARGSTADRPSGAADHSDELVVNCPDSDPDCRLALSVHGRAGDPR